VSGRAPGDPAAAQGTPGAPHAPLVVAHRGDSTTAAEHTLSAYRAAIDSGADGLECDVRMTRDGYLVCVHDRWVNRTSTGQGLVSEFTLAELNALDFSSWHLDLPSSADQLLPDLPYGEVPERAGTGVLTLWTLLELVRDAARPVRLLVETKHPTRYSGLVEKELVSLLAQFGWAGRPSAGSGLPSPTGPAETPVTVMSFAPTALRRVRLLAPDVPRVLLLDRLPPMRRDGLLPAGVRIAGPGLEILLADPDYVARAHRRGNQVYVWTVDDPADVSYVLSLDVDAVITNRPAEVARRLG
jgi:glycerophosphoryl diester phosphodiesterase